MAGCTKDMVHPAFMLCERIRRGNEKRTDHRRHNGADRLSEQGDRGDRRRRMHREECAAGAADKMPDR